MSKLEATRSFDPIWEEKYSSGHAERYPWDFVVTFVFRNAPRDRSRSEIRILEVGCGTGSNLWFCAREGFQVSGVDGSESAVKFCKERFAAENLNGEFLVADFTKLPFDGDCFDLVIDRGSITCCGLAAGRIAVSEIHRVLRPGGLFLFNPYSDRHTSFASGSKHGDGLTTNITAGTMTGVGQICFYGRRDILSALEPFNLRSLVHVDMSEVLQPGAIAHTEWRAIAQKIK